MLWGCWTGGRRFLLGNFAPELVGYWSPMLLAERSRLWGQSPVGGGGVWPDAWRRFRPVLAAMMAVDVSAGDVVLNRRHEAALTCAQALALALARRFFLTWVMACWADSSCSVW